jgi:predicted small lipoprotein YifL
MRKLMIALTVSALAIAGCGHKPAAPSDSSTTPPNQAGSASSSSKPIPKPPSGSPEPLIITKQQYDQLQLNLTFEEVQKTIGLGKLIKQTEHEAVYLYIGKNGGTVELTFWDGLLNSKGANDLK